MSVNMVILGINYFFHDSSACIVKDGNLVVSIEEERLNRHKHTTSFPHAAIRKCLDVAGLDYEDVDRIAVSIKVSKDWGRKVLYGLRHINRVKPFVKHELWNAYFKQSSLKAWYEQSFSGISRSPPIDFIPHHSCHADGSFLVSPFEEAAILSIDGAGEWSTSFLGYGKGNSITRFGESYFPMSLGSFYEAATEFCGFRPNYDEGKTMGLAPMGDPDRFHSIVKELVRVDEEGGLHFDLSYFNHQFWGRRRCGAKLIDALGQPRAMDGEFEPHHMDVAAAFQRVLEDTALELCSILHRKTSARHLVIAGGVALNSVMNGKIVRDSEFDDIYVMPAAGDNGTAIGAAFVSLVEASGAERTYVHDDPYVGNEYSSEEITAIVKECKLESEVNDDVESIGADLLRDGEIIGWFQGRMEIGPRALGNRSILANPTLPHMKDKINAKLIALSLRPLLLRTSPGILKI
jgi:carbamoyltransferase